MLIFTKQTLATVLFIIARLTSAGEVHDEFTVTCFPLTIQRSDPIVQTGVTSRHTHIVVGGSAFNRTMSPGLAKDARATSCDKEIDKSNYWQPLLYKITQDGEFEAVPCQQTQVYYLNRACDYAEGQVTCDDDVYNGAKSAPLAPPAGLRMITGDPKRRTFDKDNFEHKAISHHCVDTQREQAGFPPGKCNTMRAQTMFPSCWDGRNLDSDDHKSHMAYPLKDYDLGRCPESHPKAIFTIFTEFLYDTSGVDPGTLVWAHGDKEGYGLHADFINGWSDQDRLQRAFDTCTTIGQGLNSPACSIGPIVRAKTPKLDIEAAVAAETEEDLGTNGAISKLPGDNPVRKRSRIMRSLFFGGL